MTDRERLIELLKNQNCPSPMICDKNCKYAHLKSCYEERIADHLLANGVIVPPCKIEDKLYIVTAFSKEIVESVVLGLWLADGVFSLFTIHGTIMANLIGENVFLTKEEAEQALKEREEK